MYARITTWEFDPSPEQVDKVIARNKDQVLPAAQSLPGFQGFQFLMDREAGKAVTFTLWQDQESERASLAAANSIRRGTVDTTGIKMSHAGSYEVIVQS